MSAFKWKSIKEKYILQVQYIKKHTYRELKFKPKPKTKHENNVK